MFPDRDRSDAHYPPTDIETGATFVAPGPVSRCPRRTTAS